MPLYDPSFDKTPEWLSSLRFVPEVETLYRKHVRIANRNSASIFLTATTGLWAFFAAMDFIRLLTIDPSQRFDALTYVWLTSRWITFLFLTVAILAVRKKASAYEQSVWICFIILGIAISVTSSIENAKGVFAADSSQIVILMAGFAPIGLTFYKSLGAVVVVATISIMILVLSPDEREFALRLQIGVMISVAVPIAAIGGYFREYADRKQFMCGLHLNERASTDTLTGLPNRRKFESHFQTIRNQAERDNKTIAVAIADIDFFKRYNDTYGHPAGDSVIREVGRALQKAARRPLDIVSRYGGEEFVFIFYDTDQHGAALLLQAALQNVRDLAWPHLRSPIGKVTVSIGYSICDASRDQDILAVISRADKALYAAKAEGKDRVKFFNAELGPVASAAG